MPKFERCPARIATFGQFWFDFLHLELRKCQARLKLETKPAQVLARLLMRPGELVFRKELHETLWPDRVHLDFEHGLNKSIHKLRLALSDEPSSPRFIERISGQGYRFIAPVEFSSPCRARIRRQTAPGIPAESPAAESSYPLWLVSEPWHSTAPVTPRLLLFEDAATYLSATMHELEALLKEERITSFVVGDRRVVDRFELDLYIERRKAEGKPDNMEIKDYR